ncbi:hypothetical protein, partial [Nocardia abscessus]|uniref:hypothetical protein n=1 Tax=Nocardia abscessus TaxID=120957 RepID=UPI002457F5F7
MTDSSSPAKATRAGLSAAGAGPPRAPAGAGGWVWPEPAALKPARVALAGDDDSVTYDEMIERSDRLARRLVGLG